MKTILVVLGTALVLAAAEVQTFPVSGTVVDSETGMPVTRTRVTLSNEAGEWNSVTSSDGRFSFNLPQGRYRLGASHREWGDVFGEPVPGSESGVAVVTGPTCDVTKLLFRFRKPAAIRGKIVDASGEPVPGATVELFQLEMSRGRRHLERLDRAESNDFGEYSYSRLPAGTYYLAATGAPWYSSELLMSDELKHSGIHAFPYGTVYFSGSSEPGEATPVVLRAGAELRADFVLRPTSGAELRPRFPDNSMPLDGIFTLRAHGPVNAETTVRSCTLECPNGLAAIPPGQYVLYFTSSQGGARVPVTVSGGGDIPVEIVLRPAPSLAGKIVFDNAVQRPRFPLYVNIEDEDSDRTDVVPVGSDGGFLWSSATIRRVRLHLSGGGGFFAERISVEGAVVTKGVIDVAGGSRVRVEILASGEVGGLNGFVENPGGAIQTAMVVMAPKGRSYDPDRHFATRVSTDGSYTFTNVPAGEYVLFVVNNVDFEYANPAAVQRYIGSGKAVRVEAPSGSIQNLTLVVEGGK